jgi:hypothetical protein
MRGAAYLEYTDTVCFFRDQTEQPVETVFICLFRAKDGCCEMSNKTYQYYIVTQFYVNSSR